MLYFVILTKLTTACILLVYYRESTAVLYLINLGINFVIYLLLTKKAFQRSWVTPTLLLDTLIPIYGSHAIALFFCLRPLYRFIYRGVSSELLHEIDENEFNKYTEYQKAKTQELKHEKIEDHLHDSFQIQPYLDIIMGKNVDMKLSVCIKISKFPSKNSIYILKKALQDTNYEVRYMANNSLNKIEQSFMNEIDILSDNISKFPQDTDFYKLRGNNYLRLYNIQLLDEYLSNIFLKNALDDYRYVIQNEPREFLMYVKIAFIYMKLNMHHELDLLVKKASRIGMDDEDLTKLKFYQIESYYIRKMFSKVTKACKELDINQIKHEKILTPTNYWSNL